MSAVNKKLIVGFLLFLVIMAFTIHFLLNKDVKSDEYIQLPDTALKLTILNGCGVEGAATYVKDYFIKNYSGNVNVIFWKNVDGNNFIYNRTIIAVKKNDPIKLEYLKYITGIERVIQALNPDVIEDFQIILGNDFKEIFGS